MALNHINQLAFTIYRSTVFFYKLKFVFLVKSKNYRAAIFSNDLSVIMLSVVLPSVMAPIYGSYQIVYAWNHPELIHLFKLFLLGQFDGTFYGRNLRIFVIS